jgi:hypothetical protein
MDIYDGEPWTEMDVEDLTAALKFGSTIEDAAKHLCRSGTVDEVRRKARLRYRGQMTEEVVAIQRCCDICKFYSRPSDNDDGPFKDWGYCMYDHNLMTPNGDWNIPYRVHPNASCGLFERR